MVPTPKTYYVLCHVLLQVRMKVLQYQVEQLAEQAGVTLPPRTPALTLPTATIRQIYSFLFKEKQGAGYMRSEAEDEGGQRTREVTESRLLTSSWTQEGSKIFFHADETAHRGSPSGASNTSKDSKRNEGGSGPSIDETSTERVAQREASTRAGTANVRNAAHTHRGPQPVSAPSMTQKLTMLNIHNQQRTDDVALGDFAHQSEDAFMAVLKSPPSFGEDSPSWSAPSATDLSEEFSERSVMIRDIICAGVLDDSLMRNLELSGSVWYLQSFEALQLDPSAAPQDTKANNPNASGFHSLHTL